MMNKLAMLFGRMVFFRKNPRTRTGWETPQRAVDRRISQALVGWIAAGRHREEYPSMDAVADELGVSKEQLSFYFSNRIHRRFDTWRKELRIEEAKILLVDFPDVPASAVGAMVGIPDKSNFRRQFYEQTGCTPSEWRAACLAERE